MIVRPEGIERKIDGESRPPSLSVRESEVERGMFDVISSVVKSLSLKFASPELGARIGTTY